MKNFVVYPAVFHPQEVGFWVSFPDLQGCLTEGETLEEAMKMAQDALGLFLLDEEIFPEPSDHTTVAIQNDEFVSLVALDFVEYRKKHNSKSIKKTLTIPEWLNIAAEKENVNFSQTLQEALMEKLGV